MRHENFDISLLQPSVCAMIPQSMKNGPGYLIIKTRDNSDF